MVTTKKTIAMDLVISMFKDGRIDKAEAGQSLKGLNSQKTTGCHSWDELEIPFVG